MKQLNKKQAIAFSQSKVWETWTDRQIAEFQMLQKLLCIPFSRFQEAVSKALGRPVFSSEFAFPELKKQLFNGKPKPTLEEFINLIPEDKRIVIFR